MKNKTAMRCRRVARSLTVACLLASWTVRLNAEESSLESPRLHFLDATQIPAVTFRGDTLPCHTQGLRVTEQALLVTGRWESRPARPVIVRFDRKFAEPPFVLDLTMPADPQRPPLVPSPLPLDHPGGFALVDGELWIPVSTSNRSGPTCIVSVKWNEPGESSDTPLPDGLRLAAPTLVAHVDDHVGALCYDSHQRRLWGANWDTLQIHTWQVDARHQLSSHERLDRKEFLPEIDSWQLAIQDWTPVTDADNLPEGTILAGGLDKAPGTKITDQAVVEWLDPTRRRRLGRIIVPQATDIAQPPTREGLSQFGNELYLLPGDLNRNAKLLRYQWQ